MFIVYSHVLCVSLVKSSHILTNQVSAVTRAIFTQGNTKCEMTSYCGFNLCSFSE